MPSTPTVTVTYLFDPLCGWCYAAAPALKFLQGQEGVAVVLAPTGLFAGAGARPMDAQFAAAVPLTCTVDKSAGPSSRPMSDGLMGVACTWISTSLGPGVGTGVGSRLSCKVPSGWTSERNCRAVVGMVTVVVMNAFRGERGRALYSSERPGGKHWNVIAPQTPSRKCLVASGAACARLRP